jgi:hypothetical protein
MCIIRAGVITHLVNFSPLVIAHISNQTSAVNNGMNKLDAKPIVGRNEGINK